MFCEHCLGWDYLIDEPGCVCDELYGRDPSRQELQRNEEDEMASTPIPVKHKKGESSVRVRSTVSRCGHSDEVLEWRREEWERLGASLAQARFLADTRIDVRQAEKMIEGGCSVELVERILLGTCCAGEDEEWSAWSATLVCKDGE